MKTPVPWSARKLEVLTEYQTDTTDYLRELHPNLTRVWDELDDLRSDENETVSERDDLVADLDNLRFDVQEAVAALWEVIAECEIPDDVTEKLKSVHEDLEKVVEE